MAISEIPMSGKNQKFKIRLGVKLYSLKFVYRRDRWYLDIADAVDKPLINGLPLVHGVDLLNQYKHLIKGALITVNSIPDESQSFSDLGSNIKLYWSDV